MQGNYTKYIYGKRAELLMNLYKTSPTFISALAKMSKGSSGSSFAYYTKISNDMIRDGLIEVTGKSTFLFSWNDILKDNSILRNYLSQKEKKKWISAANIESTGDTIVISDEEHAVTLKLDKKRKNVSVLLKKEDSHVALDNYYVEEDNGFLKVYKRNRKKILRITDKGRAVVEDMLSMIGHLKEKSSKEVAAEICEAK